MRAVLVWLSRWRASRRPEWLLSEIRFFLYLPIVLFGLAKLVFPEHGREVELTPYFLENRRAFFGLLALALCGYMAWSGNNKLHLVVALAYAVVAVAVFAYTKPLIT